MPVHILSPHSLILPNTTLALSLLAIAAGTTALFKPSIAIEGFGLKPVTDTAGAELAESLAQVYGIRNASMGLTNAALWYFGHQTTGPLRIAWRRTMGLLLVMNAATPLVDGIVCERQGKTTGWTHWVFVPITLLIGGALIATPGAI